jgi:hypothetical protein
MKRLKTCSYLVRVDGQIRLMHINKLRKSYLNENVHPTEIKKNKYADVLCLL